MSPFFQSIATLLLAVHLFCVALGSGLPLVLAISDWISRSKLAESANGEIAKRAIKYLLLGALSGFLYGVFVWDEPLANGIYLARSRVGFAVVELIFSLLLTLVCWRWFASSSQKTNESFVTGRTRFFRGLILFVAATNLLYHFPLLFIVVREVSEFPTSEANRINSKEFRSLIFDSKTIVTWIHFCASSVLVSLLVTASVYLKKADDAPRHHFKHAKYCIWFALGIALLQWPSGLMALTWIGRTELLEFLDFKKIWAWFLIQALVVVVFQNWVLWRCCIKPAYRMLNVALVTTLLIFVLMTVLKRHV